MAKEISDIINDVEFEKHLQETSVTLSTAVMKNICTYTFFSNLIIRFLLIQIDPLVSINS